MNAVLSKFKSRFLLKYAFIGYLAYNVLQIAVLFYFYSPSELWEMYMNLIQAARQ